MHDNPEQAITALRHAADIAGARSSSIRSDMALPLPSLHH